MNETTPTTPHKDLAQDANILLTRQQQELNKREAELRRIRDEIRVQVDLGKKEAKLAFEQVEDKWHAVKQNTQRMKDASLEQAQGIMDAVSSKLDEIRESYRKMSNS